MKSTLLGIVLTTLLTPVAAQMTDYTQIDGRWYANNASWTYQCPGSLCVVRMPQPQMSSCRRVSGGGPLFSSLVLYYGPFNDYVFMDRQATQVYRFDGRGWEIRSTVGDVICDGEIPNPFQTNDLIFKSAFQTNDRPDRVFSSGFQAQASGQVKRLKLNVGTRSYCVPATQMSIDTGTGALRVDVSKAPAEWTCI